MNSVSVVLRDTDDVAGLASFLRVVGSQNWQEEVEIVWLSERGQGSRLHASSRIPIKTLYLEPGLLASSEALNRGCSLAAGQCVIFTDGHTLPLGDAWISSAVEGLKHKMVAGVYAPVLPGPSASWVSRVGAGLCSIPGRLQKPRRIDRLPIRDFAPCNMAVSRAVWCRLAFPENESAWKSSQAWAFEVMNLGYDLLLDWNFGARCTGYADTQPPCEQVWSYDTLEAKHNRSACPRRLVR